MIQDDTTILLYRRLLDSEVFAQEGLLKVWIWCLLKASNKTRPLAVIVGRGKKTVTLEPGQFLYGRQSAAQDLGMPPSTVRNRMEKLSNMGMVDSQKDTHGSIVTIVNWEFYQDPDFLEGHQTGQPKDSQRTAEGQPKDANKKEAKDTKEEGTKKSPPPYDDVFDTWNRFADHTGVPSVQSRSEKRKSKIRIRWKEWVARDPEDGPFEFYRRILYSATEQSFLMGDNDRGWTMDFDWFFKNTDSPMKVLERAYEGKGSGKASDAKPGTKDHPIEQREDGNWYSKLTGEKVPFEELL